MAHSAPKPAQTSQRRPAKRRQGFCPVSLDIDVERNDASAWASVGLRRSNWILAATSEQEMASKIEESCVTHDSLLRRDTRTHKSTCELGSRESSVGLLACWTVCRRLSAVGCWLSAFGF